MKVAIAGFGIEGEVNLQYWSAKGADITIFDENERPSRPVPPGVDAVLGEDAFSKMQGFDLVVRTASLNPNGIKTDGKVWSATNEFFEKCPADIIGVTGTKGKGTTCSLIAEILKESGRVVHLVGNIGVPALEVLPSIKESDIVVFELSSFQLWDLQKSPHIAVVLMVEADHLDVHASMDDYVGAKSNITAHQSIDDIVIYHPSNLLSAEISESSIASQKLEFMSGNGAHVEGGDIVIDSEIVCRRGEVGLIGDHNLDNICAAITVSWQYTQNIAAIKLAVTNFKGLPHRLELVREVNGVKYYNDSFSSAPGATIAAIRSFEQPEILICGGFDRGLDYNDLAQAISEQENIKKVLLIGQTAESIGQKLTQNDLSSYEIIEGGMAEIVGRARSESTSGDVVILSPGCASFDMFKDFKDRGEQFRKAVEAIDEL